MLVNIVIGVYVVFVIFGLFLSICNIGKERKPLKGPDAAFGIMIYVIFFTALYLKLRWLQLEWED